MGGHGQLGGDGFTPIASYTARALARGSARRRGSGLASSAADAVAPLRLPLSIPPSIVIPFFILLAITLLAAISDVMFRGV